MKRYFASAVTATLIALNVAAISALPAQAQYKIDYLIRPYKDNIYDSWLFGINNQGQATGYTDTRTASGSLVRNVVIYKNGVTQVLASSPRGQTTGLAINDRGDVVGSVRGTPTYFAASGSATTIDTPGINVNRIWGLNNAGTALVNGWNSNVPQGYTENFQLWKNGTSRSLNALNTLYPYTLAPDPNDPFSGKSAFSYSFANTNLAKGDRFAAAVDYSTYDPLDPDNPEDDIYTDSFSAFVFDGVDNYHLLTSPTMGGVIRPINTLDDGSVFGWAGNHLALWNPDGTLNEILPDYAGGLRPYGYAGFSSVQMNSLGQIVAITSTRGVTFYDPRMGAWSDISASIAGLGTGIFDSIQGFNDLGQFVGLVRPPVNSGGTYGYVVSTVPEPGSIALLPGIGVSVGMLALRQRKGIFLKRKLSLLLAATAFVVTIDGAAHAQNIVQDPGFESANPTVVSNNSTIYFTPDDIGDGVWFVTQNYVGVQTHNRLVFSGNKSLDLTPGFVTNSLTQTLTTVPGQKYTLSFYANANDNSSNAFRVTFGGNPVSGIPATITQNGFPGSDPGSNSSRFTFYTADVAANSASTNLTFTATSNNGTVILDNVSVTPHAVPGPDSLALSFVASFCGAGVLRHRRKRREWL